MTVLLERTITPTENDKRLASESSQFLAPYSGKCGEVRVQLLDEEAPNNIFSLPTSALRLLNDILKEMAQGNAVTLIPVHALLTTQEAADILNISRPFLVSLLDAGKIPHQRLGSHRRVLYRDLIAFKEKSERDREEGLRELTDQAQELNMGY